MSDKEALLRDMALCPDLFGAARCRKMQREASAIQAWRLPTR